MPRPIDHEVRAGATAFTDHSALLIDLPVSPPPVRTFQPERLFELDGQQNPDARTP
jgi:hypothetical protein